MYSEILEALKSADESVVAEYKEDLVSWRMDVLRHFLCLSFITVQLLPYCYYNPYNASALITPQTAFPKIIVVFNCMNCYNG